MRKFNNEFLQRVKDSTNLIDVIRAYGIDVKRREVDIGHAAPSTMRKRPPFLFHLKMDFIIVSVAMNQVIPLNS